MNNDLDVVKRNYRMYCLVLRQLSPIQKGVQSAHAIVEYHNRFGLSTPYNVWSRVDKTLILLDGGTEPEMNEIISQLEENRIFHTVFKEDDLGNIVTSIAILVDERVFDKKKYPDFETWRYTEHSVITTHLMACEGNFDHDPNDYTYDEHYKEWVDKVVGCEGNAFLRELLSSKRLAQ